MNDQGNSSGSPIPPNGWGNQGATPQQSDKMCIRDSIIDAAVMLDSSGKIAIRIFG